MSSISDFKDYRLDSFLEDATNFVEKQKRRVYCDIIHTYPKVFDSLPKILDCYSDRKKSHWNITFSKIGEEDFYCLAFAPKEKVNVNKKIMVEKPVFFFWKIFRDDKYVTILSFSLSRYKEIRRSLDSLMKFVKGLWFAWIGSRFLETFDLFIVNILGEDAQILTGVQTAEEIGKNKKRKLRAFPLPPRFFEPLDKLRNWSKERYFKHGEINTFLNMRYQIISETHKIHFIFSMTNKSRITFEHGDFTLFVTILRPLLDETRRVLGVLKRNSYSSKKESVVFGKTMNINSFDLIESLAFRKPKDAENWFKNIVSLFESNIANEKLITFTLLSGNPYFLTHIIDAENSSSVYLSATSEDLQIVPAGTSTKEETIAKIIGILQNNVDPSITI